MKFFSLFPSIPFLPVCDRFFRKKVFRDAPPDKAYSTQAAAKTAAYKSYRLPRRFCGCRQQVFRLTACSSSTSEKQQSVVPLKALHTDHGDGLVRESHPLPCRAFAAASRGQKTRRPLTLRRIRSTLCTDATVSGKSAVTAIPFLCNYITRSHHCQ